MRVRKWAAANRHLNTRAGWAARARRSTCATGCLPRAAHLYPPMITDPSAHYLTQARKRSPPRRRTARSRLRPPARPQSAGHANLDTEHRSSSAPDQDGVSPSVWATWARATSMRPRESEGKAAGLDEDDKGGVRSEGSGPQSWARVAMSPTPTGDLRSKIPGKAKHDSERGEALSEAPRPHHPQHDQGTTSPPDTSNQALTDRCRLILIMIPNAIPIVNNAVPP